MTSLPIKSKIRGEIKGFLQIAVPLVSAQVAQSATGFADSIMMGHLGAEILAAGGLAALTFQMFLGIVSGVVMGVSPLVAEAFGAGHKKRVGLIARQGMVLSIILSIPTMLMVGGFDSLMGKLGQSPTTVTLANQYLDIILWGFFPALGFAMLRGVLSGISQAAPVMIIVIGGTFINILGNYILGFGKFGFPRMELAGLGLSSAVSLWLMFLALVFYIMGHKQLQTYRIFADLCRFKPQVQLPVRLPMIRKLVAIGVPMAIAIAFEFGLFVVVTYLMGVLGTDVLAAHQIVLQTIMIIFMVPLGMSYATTARVGQWLGQQNIGSAKHSGYVSISMAAIFMAFTGVMLFTYPEQIIGLYVDVNNPENANIVKIATSILTVAAFVQVFDGVQKTTMGALYGLQDTRIPMLLNIAVFWGIGLTTGYLLGFQFGLGGVGLWIGQSIGVTVASGVFMWRFRKLTGSFGLIKQKSKI
ncbi:MATE family efflux transporter [Mastigocoleus testarum]|uniref:Probable multidrug resistance protein NorM n=1 Tax=Mastigocoleus testarum BC008 TaxID=371196 RepID=A0A0V7ZL75_9CYAN|nr:MATE family efflux transporter [Mastigocoleus testarum]KST65233.1 MATE family efflux transporter [Mastigocoleus testarum BC008]